MNVVFDLGGVVFRWKPDELIEASFTDSESQEKIRKYLFRHSDWVELDRGTLTYEDAARRASERTGLSEKVIAEMLGRVPASLVPFEETVCLIRSVKSNGNRIFVLSNMHSEAADYLESRHEFWDEFEATVFSCRVNMAKPEKRIYEYLLEKYSLAADETVFIDDTDVNLKAAAEVGIKTIRFTDVQQCTRELSLLGCL